MRQKTDPPPVEPPGADTKLDAAEWQRVAATPEFKDLMAAKRGFIVPATVFFIVYYFALPVLVGYAPRADGAGRCSAPVNIAYLFALSQFFMAWVHRRALRARRGAVRPAWRSGSSQADERRGAPVNVHSRC